MAKRHTISSPLFSSPHRGGQTTPPSNLRPSSATWTIKASRSISQTLSVLHVRDTTITFTRFCTRFVYSTHPAICYLLRHLSTSTYFYDTLFYERVRTCSVRSYLYSPLEKLMSRARDFYLYDSLRRSAQSLAEQIASLDILCSSFFRISIPARRSVFQILCCVISKLGVVAVITCGGAPNRGMIISGYRPRHQSPATITHSLD